MSIDAVIAHSGAPRGSVYHHFPGGRDQLITEAVRSAGRSIEVLLTQAPREAPGDVVLCRATRSAAPLEEVGSRSTCRPLRTTSRRFDCGRTGNLDRAVQNPGDPEVSAMKETDREQTTKPERSPGIAVRQVVGVAVLAVFVVFLVENSQRVSVRLVWPTKDIPLSLALLIAGALGAAGLWLLQHRRHRR